ncbi:MAG: Eco57I restriction-modification methylase domain-containing protein [Sphaerochaetaceae bacterium]
MSIINKEYSRKAWQNQLGQLLDEEYDSNISMINLGFESKYLNKEVTLLGSLDKLGLKVFEVTQVKGDDPRVSITRELFKLVNNQLTQNALVFIVPEHKKNYRLSLITRDLKLDGNKVVVGYSNPRRYSYLFGIGVKKHTIEKYLFKPGRIEDIENLKNRFSIEIVNKDFYNSLSELFSKLVGGKRGKTKYQGLLKIPCADDDQLKREFAIRLIGRVVFCWFLKKKESIKGIPLIPESILSSDAVAKNSDYYHKVLEPLFFEVMNKKHEDREPDIKANQDFENIPFLNGGLFDYNTHNDYYKLYSKKSEQHYCLDLKIPDEWFTELFDLFERYNFTIDENTPVDIDISVDPEMLGRIFENLLAEINPETERSARKSSGSFYTPREIVEYMVDESLIEHILSKFKDRVKYEPKLRKLLDYSEENENDFTKQEITTIKNCLDSIRILDPACGSGAFPMGILQKMYLIRQKLDQSLESWTEEELDSIIKEKGENYGIQTPGYLYKLAVIRKSIFGVDIQPLAVEISRLRFFLTLIVDQNVDKSKDNKGIIPLPNLEFKFVAANTLIRLEENPIKSEAKEQDWTKLVSNTYVSDLKELRERYFSADSPIEKNRIKDLYLAKQILLAHEISDKQIDDKNMKIISKWDPFSDKQAEWFDPKWMFGVDNGFDIIIGNPPYIQLQKNNGLLANMYENEEYRTFTRSGDIYCLFYERGLELTKEDGLLCYITSNKWLKVNYGLKLRHYLSLYTPLLLIDLGGEVFKDATVDTNIALIRNKCTQKHSFNALDISNEKEKKHFNLYSNWAQVSSASEDAWIIGGSKTDSIKHKINVHGMLIRTLIKNKEIMIRRGIVTGKDDVFVIPETVKNSLINSCSNHQESLELSKILKPALASSDVKRYTANYNHLWLINTHNGYTDNSGNKIPRIDIEKLPTLKQHLDQGKNELVSRYDQGETPYNLRTCNFLDQFEKDKIVWADIEKLNPFHLCVKKYYVIAAAVMLTSDTLNLKRLLAIMNSKLFLWEIMNVAADLGKAYRWKKTYIEKTHIPNSTVRDKDLITLVDQIYAYKSNDQDTSQLESQIDQIVYELYHLTDEEITYIEEATKR